jgi:hypothetical protein
LIGKRSENFLNSLSLKQETPASSDRRLNNLGELCEQPWQEYFKPDVILSHID